MLLSPLAALILGVMFAIVYSLQVLHGHHPVTGAVQLLEGLFDHLHSGTGHWRLGTHGKSMPRLVMSPSAYLAMEKSWSDEEGELGLNIEYLPCLSK